MDIYYVYDYQKNQTHEQIFRGDENILYPCYQLYSCRKMVTHLGSANVFAYVSLKCEFMLNFKKKEKLNKQMIIRGLKTNCEKHLLGNIWMTSKFSVCFKLRTM